MFIRKAAEGIRCSSQVRSRDRHRFRTYGKEGEIGTITNLEDNTRRNYETEWLPVYLELRYELISEYNLATKRREEDALAGHKATGHPTMPLQGFEQPAMAVVCLGIDVETLRAMLVLRKYGKGPLINSKS
jgi:hypothetical protein